MASEADEIKFRQKIAPHFDTGYSLARWLTGSDADAADVLQEACIKAYRFIEALESDSPRAWFCRIVRNTAYTLLKNRRQFVELEAESGLQDESPGPDEVLLAGVGAQVLHEALNSLPVRYREVLVLRELEEASYEEIAMILRVPSGTVMSRLSRARGLLKRKLISKEGLL